MISSDYVSYWIIELMDFFLLYTLIFYYKYIYF